MTGYQLPGSTLTNAPRVLAGEGNFAKGGESPYYTLSDDVYNNLIGSEEFARRGAISSRTSELEGATNLSASLNRNLNFT